MKLTRKNSSPMLQMWEHHPSPLLLQLTRNYSLQCRYTPLAMIALQIASKDRSSIPVPAVLALHCHGIEFSGEPIRILLWCGAVYPLPAVHMHNCLHSSPWTTNTKRNQDASMLGKPHFWIPDAPQKPILYTKYVRKQRKFLLLHIISLCGSAALYSRGLIV